MLCLLFGELASSNRLVWVGSCYIARLSTGYSCSYVPLYDLAMRASNDM